MINTEYICKCVHEMLSTFRNVGGQSTYPKWEDVSQPKKDMYWSVIDSIINKTITTPKEIHDMWAKMTQVYDPSHASLVEYESLSLFEKTKDKLVLDIVKTLANTENWI